MYDLPWSVDPTRRANGNLWIASSLDMQKATGFEEIIRMQAIVVNSSGCNIFFARITAPIDLVPIWITSGIDDSPGNCKFTESMISFGFTKSANATYSFEYVESPVEHMWALVGHCRHLSRSTSMGIDRAVDRAQNFRIVCASRRTRTVELGPEWFLLGWIFVLWQSCCPNRWHQSFVAQSTIQMSVWQLMIEHGPRPTSIVRRVVVPSKCSANWVRPAAAGELSHSIACEIHSTLMLCSRLSNHHLHCKPLLVNRNGLLLNIPRAF